MSDYGGYGIVLGVAAGGTYALTFVARRLASRFSFLVMPDERRVHTRPTATAGGGAMFVAFLAAMVVASQLKQFRPVFRANSEPLGVVLAAAVVVAIGLADDLREVSPPGKVSGQVLAGTILYFAGITMLFFRVPIVGTTLVLSPDIAPLMTVFWVVGMANAVNLIDGLDGLAAGIVAIAAGTFFVYSHQLLKAGNISADNSGLLIAVVCLGLCLGFLPHNFHPARIFMGDAGAMLLGLLMAASTLSVVGQTDNAFSGRTYFTFAPIFIPFFILGIPMLDTAFAIVRRAGRRGNPTKPDKDHLHHRLMRLGHGQRRSVMILWAWTALLSALVLYPTFSNNQGNAVIPFGVLTLGVALYTLFRPSGRRAGPSGSNGEGGAVPAATPDPPAAAASPDPPVAAAAPVAAVSSAAAAVGTHGEGGGGGEGTGERNGGGSQGGAQGGSEGGSQGGSEGGSQDVSTGASRLVGATKPHDTVGN
ncbi:MAG: UDP-GlcNAc:undecaprenyl-phosphate/decaprenyl-phosphate GlcNAc-phosphate transferase [Acidimicrobiaceae bacterium]|nr:UDP-GlcNAc:undecaprenyl-phosphate/decaprenyl-phosphate GlcNAc-phosphate transferase [Acidimicrobiaceae bacterium]